jgi:hypothetical protein
MKKMVAVGLIGLAVGLVMPGVFAQAPQAEGQKWEQFCEDHGPKKGLERANASAARHGKDGYELVGGQWNQTYTLCYRRPAR